MTRIAVIDFETTGMSPRMGDRATEVGIAMLEDGHITGRFESLMNAGVWLSPFIESFTGITNEMVAAAPPSHVVMAEAARFVGDAPMVAHNASFDRRFWEDELARIRLRRRHGDAAGHVAHAPLDGQDGLHGTQPFACTVMLARRVWPEIGSYQLGRLAAAQGVASTARAHRAMADAETCARVLARLQRDLCARYAFDHAPHEFLQALQSTPKKSIDLAAKRWQARTERLKIENLQRKLPIAQEKWTSNAINSVAHGVD